jgi:prepilin-type N-terminal cleavage/methylation domain-containing protein
MGIRHPQRLRDQSGITLMELLVAMVILGVISTMLIMGWVNLQRAAAFSVSTNNARSASRDASARAANELRGCQPTALPTASATATATPAPQAPLVSVGPWQATFYSGYNAAGVGSDGSGIVAPRLTQLELDLGGGIQKTLWLRKDTNGDGTFERSNVLARNVVNPSIADPSNGSGSGTTYTPIFRYGYRPTAGASVQWTDNADASLSLANVVAVRIRVIIDTNGNRPPRALDETTTVRLRNSAME